MEKYSVKQLAHLAGVSVRTLHLYDQIGLLTPSIRTEARYRFYSTNELLRLQQILFYKVLGFPLKEIVDVLDDPDFDIIKALENHKASLKEKQNNISTLIETIDKTIIQLKKGKEMLKPEELYEGFPKEKAEDYRKEAVNRYGDKSVMQSENYLRSLKREDFEKLKLSAKGIFESLFEARTQDPESKSVQELVEQHYKIIRQFWGTADSVDTQADAYAGLGDLYISDERFTMINNTPQPDFAAFLNKAMKYFAKNRLR